jgi:hypothetical protein
MPKNKFKTIQSKRQTYFIVQKHGPLLWQKDNNCKSLKMGAKESHTG